MTDHNLKTFGGNIDDERLDEDFQHVAMQSEPGTSTKSATKFISESNNKLNPPTSPQSTNDKVFNIGTSSNVGSDGILLVQTYVEDRSSKILLNYNSLDSVVEVTKISEKQHREKGENIENRTFDPNQCTICGKILSSKQALKNHILTHTNKRPFKCELCGWDFIKKLRFQKHLTGWHNITPAESMNICSDCNKWFPTSVLLEIHIQNHMVNSLGVTPLCESFSDQPLDLTCNKMRKSKE